MRRQEGRVVNQARPVLAATAVVAGILMVLWLAVALAGAVPAGPASLSGSAGVVPPSSSERTLLLAPTVVFSDNFESDQGPTWTVNPFGTDTATGVEEGAWERAEPVPDGGPHPKQIAAHGGSYDLVTGAAAGYDIDGGVTSVRSPAIALPAGAWDELGLAFYYYLAHADDSSEDDYLEVKVVGSETITPLVELGDDRNDDASWALEAVSLLDLAGQSVYILIEAADEAGDSLVEAAIDDVVIMAVDNTPPTSTATSPLEVTGGSIPVGWTAGDTASGLAEVCLWYKSPSVNWTDSEMCSSSASGTFTFNPAHGEGDYYFQTVATDNAGNSEPGASHDGHTQTHWVPAQPVYLPLALRNYAPLTNGGFEDGWVGWSHGGALRQSIISNDGWSGPHSGTYAARLGDPTYACNGGVPLGTAWVERTITVPSSGVSSLRIWYRIYSQDFYSEPYYDRFQVLINGGVVHDDGNVAAFDYCNMAPISQGWEYVDVDVTGYLGRNITLRLENVSDFDNWYNTWTYVDDIQFVP